MTMKLKYILPLALAAVSLSTPLAVVGAETKPAAPATEKPAAPAAPAAEEKKDATAKTLPFQGKVASVDATAKTFTTKNKDGKENVFSVTEKTKVEKADGTAATLADLKADDVVRGSRIKLSEGKWEVVKLIIGAKDGDAAKAAKPADAKPAAAKPVEKK